MFNTSFRDCTFNKCQIILVILKNTMFSDIQINESKVQGIDFSECNNISFSIDFHKSILDSVVMFEKNLKRTKYIDCVIKNTDFDNCEMKSCNFSGTKFETTSFHNCDLEKCDFSKAAGYQIDPVTNKQKDAMFSIPEVLSFLGYLKIKIVD